MQMPGPRIWPGNKRLQASDCTAGSALVDQLNMTPP